MARRPTDARLPRRKKRRGGRRPAGGPGFTGLVAVLCTAATAMVAGALGLRFRKRRRDRSTLDTILAKPMRYTDHAICRMDCRHIPATEVVASLRSGSVNDHKSDTSLLPCPKVVVDASVGNPKKNIQTVFSACALHTDVVTVIDKDKDWQCYCP